VLLTVVVFSIPYAWADGGDDKSGPPGLALTFLLTSPRRSSSPRPSGEAVARHGQASHSGAHELTGTHLPRGPILRSLVGSPAVTPQRRRGVGRRAADASDDGRGQHGRDLFVLGLILLSPRLLAKMAQRPERRNRAWHDHPVPQS